MAKQHHILVALALLIFGGWTAHYFNREPMEFAGVSCSQERVVTFGWTNEDRARAELAAILRWKSETKKLRLGAAYGEWHHAQDRFLRCRRIGGRDGQFQCKISATPCRPKVVKAGV
ncbi:MAG: hypothetical protein OEM91_03895 [Hyphomicrobiales bacterium]|nr:hypothetical protein [Hyphomicrobiales bacterium]